MIGVTNWDNPEPAARFGPIGFNPVFDLGQGTEDSGHSVTHTAFI